MKNLPALITTTILMLFMNSCYSKTPLKVNSQIPLKKLVDSLKIKKQSLEIVIIKSQNILCIKSGAKTLKTYPVVFGRNTVDDKLIQGDGCTPEGTFKVRTKYPHKNWSKFVWIDYPNKQSKQKFNEAIKSGKIPANSKIGGDIGIHGVPKGADYVIDNKQNWTLGCISLKTSDINEIYAFVFDGMKIEILK